MKKPLILTASMLALAAAGSAALAHHSGAMFDRSKESSMEAVVHEWRWSNPHSWLQVVTEDAEGNEVLWSFEATSQQILARQGWRRTSLVPGESVMVHFNPFRDGAPGGNLVRVTKPDGTMLGPPPRQTGSGE